MPRGKAANLGCSRLLRGTWPHGRSGSPQPSGPRCTRQGLEEETGIRAPDLARVLKVAAPQQRRLVVLDCCFAEAAARAFVGMGALDQAVAASAARDIGEALPSRGGLLLCAAPVGQVAIGASEAERTLFTGAVIKILRGGADGRPPVLSFADLRDAAYECMLTDVGASAPRPVLYPVNQAQGDLTRLPAFPNRASLRNIEFTRQTIEKLGSGSPGTA